MSRGRFELTVGAQLWFEGALWHVQRIDPNGVELTNGRSAIRVSVAKLYSNASLVVAPEVSDTEDELVAIVLGSLTREQRQALEERAKHVREVIAASGVGSAKTAAEAYKKKSDELGVSVRTIERWVAGYRDSGLAGLADSRLLRRRKSRIDPRWDEMCERILNELVPSSTPTQNRVIDRISQELEATYGPGEVTLPSPKTARERLKELSKGRHTFGSAKNRRSVADRPSAPYGRLRATRPGEFVVLDTTPLDVFAMEPVTLRWLPVELTVAQDLFTRCIVGMQLTPVSTKARDVANVLYQAVTPQDLGTNSAAAWPYHGLPKTVLVKQDQLDGASNGRRVGLPACLPEAIVVDHGKQYLSAHVIGACARLGISVQPAIPHKATDKPTVERFFRTVRESLLQHLPGYKGPDVYSRGKNIEQQAFYYVTELEQIVREWVGVVYHHTKHDGLCIPQMPRERFSPAEMFEIGLAQFGSLTLPARPDLTYEFLDVAWRTIQHYGVEINGQRYDGEVLNAFRNMKSPYGGANAGKWPFCVDSHDVRYVFFRHPETGQWARLEWEHAKGLNTPFSQEAANYAKSVSVRANRHVDPAQAIQDLLRQWGRDEVVARRDRSLARRLSSQRHQEMPVRGGEPTHHDEQREVASLPTVVDLLTRKPIGEGLQVVDDLDVFEQYYREHPDEDTFEVFDE